MPKDDPRFLLIIRGDNIFCRPLNKQGENYMYKYHIDLWYAFCFDGWIKMYKGHIMKNDRNQLEKLKIPNITKPIDLS